MMGGTKVEVQRQCLKFRPEWSKYKGIQIVEPPYSNLLFCKNIGEPTLVFHQPHNERYLQELESPVLCTQRQRILYKMLGYFEFLKVLDIYYLSDLIKI